MDILTVSDYGPNPGDAVVVAFLAFVGIVGPILGIAVYVVTSWFQMKVFDKAGVQGGWRAWVPVYSTMIFFKLGDLSPWLVLYALGGTVLLSWIGIGFLFGLAFAVLSLLAAYRVGLKLQKEGAWVVLYFFLSLVWLGINAFDRSRWNPNVPPASWASNAFLGDRTVWDGVPVQPGSAVQPGYGQQPGYPPQPGAYPPPAPGAYPQQGYGQPGAYPPPAPGAYPPPTGYAPPTQAYTPPEPPAPPAPPQDTADGGDAPDEQPPVPPAPPERP